METKRIKVGQWSFEQSNASFGYHLYKDVKIAVIKEGKETGEIRIDTKIKGYDMPLKSIIRVISEDEIFCEEVYLNALLERMGDKLEEVTERILEQIKNK